MPTKHEQQATLEQGKRRAAQPAPQRDVAPTQSAQPAQTVMGAPTAVLRTADIAALQRTMGNQAVQRMLGQRTPDPIQRKGDAAATQTAIDAEHAKHAPNFAAPRSKDAPAAFKVTVAVYQGLAEGAVFAKKRMKSTVRNKVRAAVRKAPGASTFVRKAKTGTQIKEKAAVKAVEKTTGAQAQVADPAVQNVIANSSDVGHSWIKLSTVGANGNVLQTYSFGFIPANGAAHGPQQAVPGDVRNPDLEFETEATNRYLDTTVGASAYHSALRKIAQLMGAPPQYMTIGYNCTQFTKDIAKAAGATFPSKAGMMIPISDRGFMKRAMNPNALYGKLDNYLDTKNTSDEQTMLQDDDVYQGANGIASTDTRLLLMDMMKDDDDPASKVKVDRDEMVLPTGGLMGDAIEVDYNGRRLYAQRAQLEAHLEQQLPTLKSIHTLLNGVTVTTLSGAASVIKGGTTIMVSGVDGDDVTIESARPNVIKGTLTPLEFWQALM